MLHKNITTLKIIHEMLMIESNNAFFISAETIAHKFFNMKSSLFIKKLKRGEIQHLSKSDLNNHQFPVRSIVNWLIQHREIAMQNINPAKSRVTKYE